MSVARSVREGPDAGGCHAAMLPSRSRRPGELVVHSVRLYPRGGGAASVRISGIAARCDWVVLSDYTPPYTQLVRRREGNRPRHVFLCLRKPFAALAFFYREVLPLIQGPFRLISGSEDVTLPHQRDLRWRSFDAGERRMIAAILEDPRLICWAAENLDSSSDPRWLPLPLGMVFEDGTVDHRLVVTPCPPQAHRPLRFLCAHRLRPGEQWDVRRQISRLCREHLSLGATVIDEEVSLRRFEMLMRRHAFVLCAAGGGLDPSPKAWQALIHGAIPVIRSSALDGAYRQLPVVILRQWSAEQLLPGQLRRWQQQLLPWFDDPQRRAEILHRLSGEYWWRAVNRYRPTALASGTGETVAVEAVSVTAGGGKAGGDELGGVIAVRQGARPPGSPTGCRVAGD